MNDEIDKILKPKLTFFVVLLVGNVHKIILATVTAAFTLTENNKIHPPLKHKITSIKTISN